MVVQRLGLKHLEKYLFEVWYYLWRLSYFLNLHLSCPQHYCIFQRWFVLTVEVELFNQRGYDIHNKVMNDDVRPFITMFEQGQFIKIFHHQFVFKAFISTHIFNKSSKILTNFLQLLIFILISLNIFMTQLFDKLKKFFFLEFRFLKHFLSNFISFDLDSLTFFILKISIEYPFQKL